MGVGADGGDAGCFPDCHGKRRLYDGGKDIAYGGGDAFRETAGREFFCLEKFTSSGERTEQGESGVQFSVERERLFAEDGYRK